MITISTERGFVEVESWDEIESLPGFTDNLIAKDNALKAIFGRYVFKSKQHCGLSHCHTPHNKGYVVSTQTGLVTNIGTVCGKINFGVEFDQLTKVFERDRTAQLNREIVGSFLSQEERHSESLNKVLNEGGSAVYRNVQTLITPSKGCPDAVAKLLSKMVRDQRHELIRVRQATKEERDTASVMGAGKASEEHIVEEVVGALSGIEILYSKNDLRDLLVLDLQAKFRELLELDIDTMEHRSLRDWSEWCQGFERKIERAEGIVAIGMRFLSPGNLEQISLVLDGDDDALYRKHLGQVRKLSLTTNQLDS